MARALHGPIERPTGSRQTSPLEKTLMSIILWIVMGLLVGWIASVITKTEREGGAALNVIVGALGAMLGGFLMRLLGRSSTVTHEAISLYSVFVAVLGASVLLAVLNLARRSATR